MAIVIVRLHARAGQYGAIPSNIPGSARAQLIDVTQEYNLPIVFG
jgi:hypothetical protein